MTYKTLRETAQMALEALYACACPAADDAEALADVAYAALRDALALPDEPVAWAITMPSGKISQGEEIYNFRDDAEERLTGCIPGCGIAPLYATPVERKPLTDRQAYDCLASTVEEPEPFEDITGDEAAWAEVIEVVRAVEAAHNIK